MRGRLVSMNQLTIALGVMLAQIVNWLIAQADSAGNHAIADSVRFLERSNGLAVDVWCDDVARGDFFRRDVFCPGESPVVGEERTIRTVTESVSEDRWTRPMRSVP